MCDGTDDLNTWRLTQSKLHKLFVHDLKNPISALAANLSFLETALVVEPEEVRGAVTDSILASEMLLRFAENLNLIAMLEASESCGVSQIGLENFVRSVARRNEKFATSAGVRLLIVEPLEDTHLLCQYRYAELALENLILSAIRHSPQGGEVEISSVLAEGEVHVHVCDHGRPVDGEHATALFSREMQSEAKKYSGSRYGRGLGLYAIGLAVKALNGRVNLGVRDDGMTQFTLVLPIVVDDD